jgi:hypothetical protein
LFVWEGGLHRLDNALTGPWFPQFVARTAGAEFVSQADY